MLYQDLIRSRLGEEAGGADTTYALPVFAVREGKFATHYSRTYVEAAQKLPNVQRLSDAQWEALDLLAALGDELCYQMSFVSGDIQFLNNHVMYHARDAFEDDFEAGKYRLLYRVWVSMANSRQLPGWLRNVVWHHRSGCLTRRYWCLTRRNPRKVARESGQSQTGEVFVEGLPRPACGLPMDISRAAGHR